MIKSMWWRRLRTVLKLVLIFLLLILVTVPEWPAFEQERYRLSTIVGLREFDFLVWFTETVTLKGGNHVGAGQAYLDEEARKQLVLDYLELVGRIGQTQNQVDLIYADPEQPDPAAASKELQEEVARLRAIMQRRQPLAEAVLQEQVAAVLAEEGFTLLGGVWPPVQMHMTPLPLVLIVSPREQIEQIYNVPLVPGLTTPDRELLETEIGERIDRSALVVPIGGLGMFPSMVVETANINFLADVVAHEWAHHWLTLHPVGINYAANAQMRTINETIASVVGTEIGARVIERFYPEFVPPETAMRSPEEGQAAAPTPPPFNFRKEMAETRARVDELLAAGQVEEAEAYMEARREQFVTNGYLIRKLNQAYFAFYGAYADTPGATGADPIGPAVLALREQSSSLRQFMDWVAPVTSFEELQEVVEKVTGT